MSLSLAPNSAAPIGYRKKIGADEQRADKAAAGIVLVAPDGHVLLLRRSGAEANFANHWGLPGGGVEEGETPEIGASREAKEEIGFDVDPEALKPLDRRTTPTGTMVFHTFSHPVPEKFAPTLNDEHAGYVWSPLSDLPEPMHPAVKTTLQEQIGDDHAGFAKWAGEKAELPATDSALTLAMDRDTVRTIDRDGRMHVQRSRITKANICPYMGSEIPGWKELGLDAKKIYQLLRDPEEIKKAAATSNGVQLLQKHTPVNADDHKKHDIVGTTGTDAEWDGESLWNSLHIWTNDAIKGIESNKKRELSCGYWYRADMTPGVFGGSAFDGIMRDIVFNHVALVEDGRAGPDVLVGDSMENLTMAKPTRFAAVALALTSASIAPLMAMDAKIDLMPLFKDVTAKGFDAKKFGLALDAALKPHLAKDASIRQVVDSLDDLEKASKESKGADEEIDEEAEKKMVDLAKVEKPKAEDVDPDPTAAPVNAFDDGPIREYLKGKGMGDDEINEACSLMKPKAADSSEPKEEDDKDMVTKGAMDAALKTNADTIRKEVRETERGIRVAIAEVVPYVGALPSTMAFDSGADVYRHTLKMLKVDGADTLHADALLPVLRAQRKLSDNKPSDRKTAMALDSSALAAAAEFAPNIGNVGVGHP